MARIRAYAVSGASPQEAAAEAPNPASGKSRRRDDNDAQLAPAATAAPVAPAAGLRQRIPTPCHRRRRYRRSLPRLQRLGGPFLVVDAGRARVGTTKGRIRRIAIVALARKLLVALWRYLETGLVPRGAVLKG
jgi:hypothetical protein